VNSSNKAVRERGALAEELLELLASLATLPLGQWEECFEDSLDVLQI